MRSVRAAVANTLSNPILVGSLTIAVLSLAVYLSYIAENGLPFVTTYEVKVQVANADELGKNADVRIGGARVGQVLSVTPEPANRAWPHPYAQVLLQLDRNLQPLPADTRYEVRLASVLGGKYLELLPGHAGVGGIPDGGTLTLNADPARNHELPFVDLDTALSTFGPRTRALLRAFTGELGDLLAGRGSALNDTTYSFARLIGPLEGVLGELAAPANHFAALLSGAAQTTSALAAVAPQFETLLANGATTFEALNRSSLGQAIEQLPPTESVASSVLNNSLPALREAAGVVLQLRAAAPLLPTAAADLDRLVLTATPVFRPMPKLAGELEAALATVQVLARDPASTETFKALGSTDLATFGASALDGLGAILRAVAPSQFSCNVAPLWLRNFASGLSEGDSTGPWLRTMPVFDPNQSSQASTPASDLHLNYYPIENASQCQAGNEAYTGKQLIGNPPRTSTTVDNTAPPPGVLARGEQAGLVP